MLGVELVKGDGAPFGKLAGAIMVRGLQEGLILLGGGPDGYVLSFSPPFAISDAEVAYLTGKLQAYFEQLPQTLA